MDPQHKEKLFHGPTVSRDGRLHGDAQVPRALEDGGEHPAVCTQAVSRKGDSEAGGAHFRHRSFRGQDLEQVLVPSMLLSIPCEHADDATELVARSDGIFQQNSAVASFHGCIREAMP